MVLLSIQIPSPKPSFPFGHVRPLVYGSPGGSILMRPALKEPVIVERLC